MINISFITLGCPKNQVDSELMMGIISANDKFNLIDNPNKAEVIVINTCAFIDKAKEEAIDTIIATAKLKETAKCKALIVTGCLSQRYKEELLNELPEIDAIIGTAYIDKINSIINEALNGQKLSKVGNPTFHYKGLMPRKLSNSHYAYVKIAEGCNNHCSYCSIPEIRGALNSRPLNDLVEEIKDLVNQGVKEVILVAQDTTQYGIDLYGHEALTELLTEIVNINKLDWIRLMYSYPEHVNEKLIEIIANEKKICKYLDLPIQHSSNRIREEMNRPGKKEDIFNLINHIRDEIPNIALRTSLIVGFPGETEKDFLDLKDFIKELKFERLGVFQYSQEENTLAAKFPQQISAELKEKRYQQLMELQQVIALSKNQELIGKTLEVIIDEIEGEFAIARSQYDAPEIDNTIYIKNRNLQKGDLIIAKIKEAYEYDLIGEKCHEFTK